ncbi:SDR family NAD(P)-dependent oxidoreductase [Nonomuraea sp. M3C6]|uniref:SDR family NAD(P)-dependent oxidoreductase n=1 Tax=Nonomuraea marmarensis TaxID=3351344 RepID=A0ABW7ATE5_9ACTN
MGNAHERFDCTVTEADKGIGKQIAAQLAAAGVSVYVGSRDPERGQQAVDEIGGRARLLVWARSPAGSPRASAANTARSAHDSLGRPT